MQESTDLVVSARADTDLVPASVLLARQETVREVLVKVMRPNVDYGVIPGTKEPTLFKPGAEKIGLTFGIAVVMDTIESVTTEAEIYFRVRATASKCGLVIGTHEAVCSTREKKYRWKRPICQEEFDEAPASAKQTTWAKDRAGKPIRIQSVRMDIGEVIHTCLAMAQKRAYTGVIMRVTGASDIFAEEEGDDRRGGDRSAGPDHSAIVDLVAAYNDAKDEVEMSRLEKDREQIWPKLDKFDRAALKSAADAAKGRIHSKAKHPAQQPEQPAA